MTAGRRIDAADAAEFPLLPRPLSDEAGAVAVARALRRRTPPARIEPQFGPVSGRARGTVVLVCLLVVVLLAALPGLAQACAPATRTEGDAIRLDAGSGIERAKLEIGYRRSAATHAGSARTYYQVVSAPVAADGTFAYRPPLAHGIVSARVLDAKGPACD